LRPRFVSLEGRCSAGVILHGELSGMADGRAQDPFAIAARPSCEDGGGRVCACAYPIAGAVEQRLAAAEVSPVAGPSGDQASAAGGADKDGIGRVFWRHVELYSTRAAANHKAAYINHAYALVGRPLRANSVSFFL
jgi:hypothetical protein